MQAKAIIASSARKFGPLLLLFIVLTAALRRPIVEAIAMSPQHFASRFEPLASSDLVYVLALLPGVLSAPKAWARLHAGSETSVRFGLALGAIVLVSGSWSADPAASVGTIGMALLTAVALFGATTWFVTRDQHRAVAILEHSRSGFSPPYGCCVTPPVGRGVNIPPIRLGLTGWGSFVSGIPSVNTQESRH